MEEINNFIKTIMEKDLAEGKVKEIVTRFPPEPNAYLHIGHARAIVNDFELAACFGGYTNLRFDDTNPVNEGAEYVDAIIEDLKWLGYTPKNVYITIVCTFRWIWHICIFAKADFIKQMDDTPSCIRYKSFLQL